MISRGAQTGRGARRALSTWAAVLCAAACAAGALLVILRSRAPVTPSQSNETTAAPDSPADWCAPGFEPIVGGGCLALSSRPGQPLIIYLHGRYARDLSADEVDRQRRLAARATSRGFAVLALRGRLGTCTNPELADWFCWPSNEHNSDAGEAFVSGWAQPLSAAQERSGSRARYLLGFSNGGYFAGLIASRGLLDVDAVVVAHGGPVEPVHALRTQPPLLLLSADDDIAQDEMIALHEALVREGWPHDSYARTGGHALTDEDIDSALAFFSRAKEPLPLRPPLPLHRPIRHDRDAGTDAEATQQDAEATQQDAEATQQGQAQPAPQPEDEDLSGDE
jgi:predicted esterase